MFVFAVLFVSDQVTLGVNMNAPAPNPHLPPHLREVCTRLAAGLVRLQGHTDSDLARDTAGAREQGASSLHCRPQKSGHVVPRDEELA